MPRRLLLVDDDASIRTSVAEALQAEGYVVEVAEHGVAALAMIARTQAEVVLSDVRMPDLSGLELLTTLRARAPHLSVVLMSAYDDMPTVVEAMQQGAADFLVKPLDLDDLHDVLNRVYADRATRRAAGAPPTGRSSGMLVGRDPQMITVYKQVGQAAQSNATVLVRGESGTGKELVARAIHTYSTRRENPFVPVNCAALPPTLLESELFGHVRGAFTGALGDRKGRFALAGRGTLFLDEIGDTSIEFQSKLLRVLQDHEYQPVGADVVQRTEARVIAATHQPLEDMVADRRFREDLYYRLRVMEIVLPPLRERLGDIPMLAQHVLARAGEGLGVVAPVLADDALEALSAHRWPGNVRELEHCLMRAVVVAAGGVVRARHLSLSSPPRRDDSPMGEAHVPSLDDVERVHVAHVLRLTHGRKGRAAELLGVSRPRLARLIEKYGLA
jgi:DNA-binding NtrC family response regulator